MYAQLHNKNKFRSFHYWHQIILLGWAVFEPMISGLTTRIISTTYLKSTSPAHSFILQNTYNSKHYSKSHHHPNKTTHKRHIPALLLEQNYMLPTAITAITTLLWVAPRCIQRSGYKSKGKTRSTNHLLPHGKAGQRATTWKNETFPSHNITNAQELSNMTNRYY